MSSIRSVSVTTGELARIGNATASTSLASRSATSCGRCLAPRRLCDKALPHRQLNVFRHGSDDVMRDFQLCLSQQGTVDLARQLVRHLGAHRSGRLRQQTRNVGLRKG